MLSLENDAHNKEISTYTYTLYMYLHIMKALAHTT